MNFAIQILNESKYRSAFKVDGYSGSIYSFKWHDKKKVYVYQPKNQAEVDDIFNSMGRTTRYIFAPLNLAEAAVAPVEKTVEQAKSKLTPALSEQSILRGIIVSEDDTDETAQRLIAAYDKGATDTLERFNKKKPKADKPTPAS